MPQVTNRYVSFVSPLKLTGIFLAALFAIATTSFSFAQSDTQQPYKWRVVNDGAGSNTVGMVIHPLDSNIMYTQLGDTGGYRWNPKTQSWINYADWSGNVGYAYNSGVAIDPKNKKVFYYAAGDGESLGDVFKSIDRGVTFTPSQLRRPDGTVPYIRGADNTSHVGPRLMVDPNNSSVIYFASRFDGLWKSESAASPKSWKQVKSFAARGDISNTYKGEGSIERKAPDNSGLSFVAFDQSGGTTVVNGKKVTKIIYVGVLGDRYIQKGGNGGSVTTLPENGVWRSTDGGQSWRRLGGGGYVARGYVASNGTLYTSGPGKVSRNGRSLSAIPVLTNEYCNAIAVDPRNPQHVVTAVFKLGGDNNQKFYRSTNGGTSWQRLEVKWSNMTSWYKDFANYVPFLVFDPNSFDSSAGVSKIVWAGDWAHPWRSKDITAATTTWEEIGKGHNGAYVNSMANPPALKGSEIAPFFYTGADNGGFRIKSVTTPPTTKLTNDSDDGGLADGTSIAYSESDPNFMAAVGGWDHGGQGGGGTSTDNGKTWKGFENKGLNYPGFGSDPKLGRIAVGATKQPNGYPHLVWIPRFQVPRYSTDWGQTWNVSQGAPSDMTPSEWDPWQTLAADPVNGSIFYAFSNNLSRNGNGEIYRSKDGGATWSRAGAIPLSWKERTMSNYHLKTMPGKTGNLWVSLHDSYSRLDQEPAQGLFHSTDGGASWTKVKGLYPVYSFAFGAPAPGRKNPTLFVAGTIRGVKGIFRSDDATSLSGNLAKAKWVNIWAFTSAVDSRAVILGLGLLGADRQQYGRVYAGANGRGSYVGDPVSPKH